MKRFAFLVAVLTAVLTLVLPFVGGSGQPVVREGSPANTSQQAAIPATVGQQNIVPATVGQQSSMLVFASESRSVQKASEAIHVSGQGASSLASQVTGINVAISKTFQYRTATPSSGSDPVPPRGDNGDGEPDPSEGDACQTPIVGNTAGAPGTVSAGGVSGTTSEDLAAFAVAFNDIRVANCLEPIPFSNIRYDSCMEARLFWMAEDPSDDPASAWGHIGTVRSDGVPSVGCDGNLAGGAGNTGATAATKWWNSTTHRNSLYRPNHTGSVAGVCVHFAMTHGGIPNELYSFTRAAAKWGSC